MEWADVNQVIARSVQMMRYIVSNLSAVYKIEPSQVDNTLSSILVAGVCSNLPEFNDVNWPLLSTLLVDHATRYKLPSLRQTFHNSLYRFWLHKPEAFHKSNMAKSRGYRFEQCRRYYHE